MSIVENLWKNRVEVFTVDIYFDLRFAPSFICLILPLPSPNLESPSPYVFLLCECIIKSILCFLWFPCRLRLILFKYHLSGCPVRALPCAMSYFCFGVLWAPCRLFLLLGCVVLGCVHWTPPFFVDLVYHIYIQNKRLFYLCHALKWVSIIFNFYSLNFILNHDATFFCWNIVLERVNL
jgi:hypothetical protein